VTPTPEAQSALNQARWWAHHGYVPPDPIRTAADRCYYAATNQLLTAICDLVVSGVLVQTARPANHGGTALRGYREDVGRCSAQVIVHQSEVEMDFDLYNPRDIVDGIGHAVEVLRNKWTGGKTDPFKIAAQLRKRGIHGDVSG
jgi:hypothetical protein